MGREYVMVSYEEYDSTIDSLVELRDENAKLREQVDTAKHNGARNAREYARLCHENDRLRELCTALYKCRDKVNECGTCEDVKCSLMHDCRLHDRMRELGVEVDG